MASWTGLRLHTEGKRGFARLGGRRRGAGAGGDSCNHHVRLAHAQAVEVVDVGVEEEREGVVEGVERLGVAHLLHSLSLSPSLSPSSLRLGVSPSDLASHTCCIVL